MGEVVVAWVQTQGRGQRGREWHDGDATNVALTAVLEPVAAARLSVLGALAVVEGIEAAVGPPVCTPDGCTMPAPPLTIKWPNDVFVRERKIAGVLVEIADGRALVGIGINVAARAWPEALRRSATSLADEGIDRDRAVVAAEAIVALHRLSQLDNAVLAERYSSRDALRGRHLAFRCGEASIAGTVLSVDPFSAVRLRTDDGRVVELDPAITHVQRA